MCYVTHAQNIGVNTDTPHTSSVLELNATDKGYLLPRVSLDSVNGIITPINTPSQSLFVINTNPNTLYSQGEGPYFFKNGFWEYYLERNTLDDCYDKGGNGAGYFIDADSQPVHIASNGAGLNDSFVVTGKLSIGYTYTTLSTFPNFGDGTTFFYNPSKAAFRSGKVTGTQWDLANTGRHSFANGLNVTALGNRTFVVGLNNIANRISATAFGQSNSATAEMAFLTGSNNSATGKRFLTVGRNITGAGYDGFSSGIGNNTRVSVETIVGTYTKTYPKTDNSGGNDPGSGLLPIGTDSQWTHYATDRVFAVGIGTGVGTEKNGFEVIKNGTVIINEAYKLPTTDGTNDQILKTDGNDNLSWSSRILETNISNLPMIADNSTTTINKPQTANNPVPGYKIPFVIGNYDYDGDGQVEIKCVVNYINRTLALNGNLPAIRLDILSSSATILGSGSYTYTNNTGDGVAYTTNWTTVTLTTNVLAVDGFFLTARNLDGGVGGTADNSEITIGDVSILVRDK